MPECVGVAQAVSCGGGGDLKEAEPPVSTECGEENGGWDCTAQ